MTPITHGTMAATPAHLPSRNFGSLYVKGGKLWMAVGTVIRSLLTFMAYIGAILSGMQLDDTGLKKQVISLIAQSLERGRR